MYFDLSNRNLTTLIYSGDALHILPRAFEIIGERYSDGSFAGVGTQLSALQWAGDMLTGLRLRIGCAGGCGWPAPVFQLKITYGNQPFNWH